jgi:hypothetical protein
MQPNDFIKDKQQLFEISGKNKKLSIFIDTATRNQYEGRLSNIDAVYVDHYCYDLIGKLYTSGSTKHLTIILGNNLSNFMFTNEEAQVSDGLDRFLLRVRTGMIYTPQKKHILSRRRWDKSNV